ncbi:MAG: hypothetical protein Q9222_006486 [Ikaeria aurantiellina]
MAEYSDIDVVISIFKKLSTVDQRNTFIEKLLRSLPANQIRQLVEQCNSVDFHFDIISNLPHEILCLVFQNLEIREAYRLRRVSKSWLRTLSASEFVETLLHPWFAMGHVDLRIPPDSSPEIILALKSEHVQSFVTGNPFGMIQSDWKAASSQGDGPLRVAYSKGRLAWIDTSFKVVHLKNLEFGQETLFIPPNREKVEHICMSSDLVMVTTRSGKCYAWDSVTGAPSSLQLPSAWISSIRANGKTAVICQGTEDTGPRSLTIWHVDTGKSRSFDASLSKWPPRPHMWYDIKVTDDSVIHFEFVRGPPDELLFSRYTFDGQVIARGTSGLIHRFFRSGYLSVSTYPERGAVSTTPVQQLDLIHVREEKQTGFRDIRKQVVEESRGIVRLVYDLRTNRLLDPQGSATTCQDFEVNHCKESALFIWKTIAHRCCIFNNSPVSAAYDLHHQSMVEGYCNRLDYDMEDRFDEDWPERPSRNAQHTFEGASDGEPIWFYGDEIYMIRVYPSGFTAFCFDKNINMAGENRRFREKRAQILRNGRKRDSKTPRLGRFKNVTDLEEQLVKHEKILWANEGAP